MNTINCPSCNNAVSSELKKCPHCGSKKHLDIIQCKDCKGQMHKKAACCPHCGSKKHRDIFRNHPIICTLIGISLIGMMFQNDSEASYTTPIAPTPAPIKKEIVKPVEFHDIVKDVTFKSSWSKTDIGSVMTLNGSISNKSKHTIYDIKIGCIMAGESGTAIDLTERVLYKKIPPQSTKKFSDLNMGFIDKQSVGANCLIADFEFDK